MPLARKGRKEKIMTDYIRRADAIEAACNEMDWLDDGCVEERKTMIKDALSALPSADAVHGEWEDREVFNDTDDDHIVEEWQSARCSVCGKYHTTPYMYYFDDFNFCPNCGARMKGGAE